MVARVVRTEKLHTEYLQFYNIFHGVLFSASLHLEFQIFFDVIRVLCNLLHLHCFRYVFVLISGENPPPALRHASKHFHGLIAHGVSQGCASVQWRTLVESFALECHHGSRGSFRVASVQGPWLGWVHGSGMNEVS